MGRLYEGMKEGSVKSIMGRILYHIASKKGIEISFEQNKIGGGLQLSHPYGITVNGSAILGDNVTLYKGSTIGSVRNGKLKGAPVIGSNVVICANAFVCGNIHVGDNVLIAANAFVDFDVPTDSVVIGNPGQIHHKENMKEIIALQRGLN